MEVSVYGLLSVLAVAALVHLWRTRMELRRLDRRLDSARLKLESRIDALKRRIDQRLRSLRQEAVEAHSERRGGRRSRNLH